MTKKILCPLIITSWCFALMAAASGEGQGSSNSSKTRSVTADASVKPLSSPQGFEKPVVYNLDSAGWGIS